MNADQQALYQQIVDFQIDAPGVQLTFAHRLARENNWSRRYTQRVIVEYKKFLFLAMVAGHVVSPSEQVDQAWHMHLTYTKSYWENLCQNVLGKPLHHGPTQGGDEEQRKYIDLYQQTLASYEAFFGSPAPRDIWSPAEQRFGEDLQHVTVNTARYWIVRKPRLPRIDLPKMRLTPLLGAGLIGFPCFAAGDNPLDYKGPEFLIFYGQVALVAGMVAIVIRWLLSPGSQPADTDKPIMLEPYEIACLAGGPLRAVHAAFTALVHAGSLRLTERDETTWGVITQKKTFIEQGEPLTSDAPQLEHALYDAATIPTTKPRTLFAAAQPLAEDIEHSLYQRGLVYAAQTLPWACILSALIMASPLVIGVAKIITGVSRGRPVGFLVAACVVTVLIALVFLFSRSRTTTAGQKILDAEIKKHAETKVLAATAPDTLSPISMALAVGLFGGGMLTAGSLAQLGQLIPEFRAPNRGWTSNSWNSGGCSGGCSGGGGCGGGCGGGGCGGCGS